MNPLVKMLELPDTTIAVVGATEDRGKYGSVVYRDLKRKGYAVFAVNPGRSSVDGDPAYPTLSDLPQAPDIINLVVPASIGLDVVAEAGRLGYDTVWLQPGAESPALIGYLQDHGFEYLTDACIMVRSLSIEYRKGLEA